MKEDHNSNLYQTRVSPVTAAISTTYEHKPINILKNQTDDDDYHHHSKRNNYSPSQSHNNNANRLYNIDQTRDMIRKLSEEPKNHTASSSSPPPSSSSSVSFSSLSNQQPPTQSTTTPPPPIRTKGSNTHFQYATTAYGVRMLSKDISNTKIDLEVENLMIVTKLNDVSLYYLTRELVEWILINFPSITVYVDAALKDSKKFAASDIYKDSKCKESRIKYWTPEFVDQNDVFFDLCVTMGGDGTVLFVSSIFKRHVPPILSFSLGSLGFLTNFKFENFRQDLKKILSSKIKTNLRMRLECNLYKRHEPEFDPKTGKKICVVELISTHHVLNEVTIDRGPSPFISMLELYSEDNLMTVAQADGLIIATPTGSTAYSLSAGGSLIYPTVNAIAVTPICPHTLSFRPIILPESMTLKVKVSTKSRGTAWASFDGKDRVELQKGDFIKISASPYFFPTVECSNTEFINSISRTLNWNQREQQKSLTHMLSRKNQEKYATEAKVIKHQNNSDSSYIEEVEKCDDTDSETAADEDNEEGEEIEEDDSKKDAVKFVL
ncbi:NADH/NAD(+) kinase NDAI_0B01230 [Naumovozyma dairenensis CBS 421]|uniref:NAD+ kinase n=1 Tax=Naumovozyma dairenensis (strain ATCC 10597 / BCRC 20456 / CBS 421 / NBRC 0211 / NRRL Y-12639) TaxID=1071378 RepID=G0W5U6_NAUDC|nr:hypothetical protein NDAI_0B01230 [Naumovozyma dairenensis CBS 421]CCD23157.1 hypothetical protein NDAI_0B01230 [Naumovozyma dairenensis CBS 421]